MLGWTQLPLITVSMLTCMFILSSASFPPPPPSVGHQQEGLVLLEVSSCQQIFLPVADLGV